MRRNADVKFVTGKVENKELDDENAITWIREDLELSTILLLMQLETLLLYMFITNLILIVKESTKWWYLNHLKHSNQNYLNTKLIFRY